MQQNVFGVFECVFVLDGEPIATVTLPVRPSGYVVIDGVEYAVGRERILMNELKPIASHINSGSTFLAMRHQHAWVSTRDGKQHAVQWEYAVTKTGK